MFRRAVLKHKCEGSECFAMSAAALILRRPHARIDDSDLSENAEYRARLSITTMSPLAQGRDETLLDGGAEAVTVHWPIEHTGRSDQIDPQGGEECRRLPIPPRDAGDQAVTTRAAAITARHVGLPHPLHR